MNKFLKIIALMHLYFAGYGLYDHNINRAGYNLLCFCYLFCLLVCLHEIKKAGLFDDYKKKD